MKQESFKFSGRASNPATKKFSPAQIAAQKLFAERARAGTLGKTVKRKVNPQAMIGREMNPSNVDNWIVSRDRVQTIITNLDTNRMKLQAAKNYFSAYGVDIPGATKSAFIKNLGKMLVEKENSNRKTNPDKSKPRAYVKRVSQATGAPPSKRLVTRRKKALTAPAGYFPNPMMTAAQVQRVKQALKESETALSRATRYSPENQDKGLINFYQKHIAKLRKSMETGKFPSDERFGTGRQTNPAAAMMTGYQVICMHPKKHVVGVFKTMAEAKQIATALANAKGVAYGVKAVKVHKTHFAV